MNKMTTITTKNGTTTKQLNSNNKGTKRTRGENPEHEEGLPDDYVEQNISDDSNDEYDFTDGFVIPDFVNEPISKRLCGLSQGHNKKFNKQLNSVREELEKREVKISDIINADISTKDKADLLEMYDIMVTSHDSETKMKYNKTIREQLSKCFTNAEIEVKNRLMMMQNIDTPLEKRILTSNHPDNIKSIIYKKFKSVENQDSEEYVKMLQWVTTALTIPTQDSIVDIRKNKTANQLITDIWQNMEKEIYGQLNVKERVVELATMIWSNPKSSRKCMVLVGPPGTGKTTFAHCLARSLGLPFYKISLGGAKDVGFLKGQSSVYIGSKHGVIMDALLSMRCLNGVLYLGELDKIPKNADGDVITAALLHIMDFNENDKFIDEYMPDIPVDLSKLMFVVSVNELEDVDPILRNRFTIVNMDRYNKQDKIEIGLNYSLPKMLSNINLNKGTITIDKSVMEYIVENTADEEGIRDLERNIELICQRLTAINFTKGTSVKLSYAQHTVTFPIKVTSKWVDILLKN